MPTQNPVPVSRAQRCAYGCGMSLKRGYRRLKTFESRVAERAVAAGLPAGKGIVRGSFLIAKLALLGALLFASVWLVTFIVMLLGAGAFSAGVIRLADWIDQPRPRRRTA